MNKDARKKMRQESDAIFTVTRDGTLIIDDGKITAYGRKLLEEEKNK